MRSDQQSCQQKSDHAGKSELLTEKAANARKKCYNREVLDQIELAHASLPTSDLPADSTKESGLFEVKSSISDIYDTVMFEKEISPDQAAKRLPEVIGTVR